MAIIYESDSLTFGTDQDDIIFGNKNSTVILAGQGNDLVFGDEGDDVIVGGDGNDYIVGGPGNDYMAGGSGSDVYSVDTVNDQVLEQANEGTDFISLSASDGNSYYYYIPDNFEDIRLELGSIPGVVGNALDNRITGNNADNILLGFDGKDFLSGGDGGNDLLLGGGGDDFLAGSSGDNGADTLNGATGADTFGFYFGNVLEGNIERNTKGLDTITDFNYQEGDKINLTVSDLDISHYSYEQGSGRLVYDNPSDSLFPATIVTLQANLGIGFIPRLDVDLIQEVYIPIF
jgi:Ca2+-binding RTX toxin-like protein